MPKQASYEGIRRRMRVAVGDVRSRMEYDPIAILIVAAMSI